MSQDHKNEVYWHSLVTYMLNLITCKYPESISIIRHNVQVYHKSERNTSTKPRHAYTFHVVETEGSHYASKNWLQPTPASPLPRLYFHTRNL